MTIDFMRENIRKYTRGRVPEPTTIILKKQKYSTTTTMTSIREIRFPPTPGLLKTSGSSPQFFGGSF